MASNARDAAMVAGEGQREEGEILSHSPPIDPGTSTQNQRLPPTMEGPQPELVIVDSPNPANAARNRQGGNNYMHTSLSTQAARRPYRQVFRTGTHEEGREVDPVRYQWGMPGWVPASHQNPSTMTERGSRPVIGDDTTPSTMQFPGENPTGAQEDRMAALQRRRDMLAAMLATEQEIEELNRLKAVTAQPAHSGSGRVRPQDRMIPAGGHQPANSKSGNRQDSGNTQRTVRSNRLQGRLNPPEGNPVEEEVAESSGRRQRSVAKSKDGGLIITTGDRRRENSPPPVPRFEDRRRENSPGRNRAHSQQERNVSEIQGRSRERGRSPRRNPHNEERRRNISPSPVRHEERRRDPSPIYREERRRDPSPVYCEDRRRDNSPVRRYERNISRSPDRRRENQRSPDMESAFERFLIRKNVLKEKPQRGL